MRKKVSFPFFPIVETEPTQTIDKEETTANTEKSPANEKNSAKIYSTSESSMDEDSNNSDNSTSTSSDSNSKSKRRKEDEKTEKRRKRRKRRSNNSTSSSGSDSNDNSKGRANVSREIDSSSDEQAKEETKRKKRRGASDTSDDNDEGRSSSEDEADPHHPKKYRGIGFSAPNLSRNEEKRLKKYIKKSDEMMKLDLVYEEYTKKRRAFALAQEKAAADMNKQIEAYSRVLDQSYKNLIEDPLCCACACPIHCLNKLEKNTPSPFQSGRYADNSIMKIVRERVKERRIKREKRKAQMAKKNNNSLGKM